MTQQQIVEAVNRLIIGYNITWDDIKYDADKAIYKINDRLGAKYPEMSIMLQGPNHHYAILADGILIPIFDSKYILTVVIPFIAMEILARDEEFTTIYNKYNMDFEDGLFTMYSNEYNRIPPMFIQDDTTGVFFTNDESVMFNGNNRYAVDKKKPIKKFLPKLKLSFNLNNPTITLTDITKVVPQFHEYNAVVNTLPTATEMNSLYTYSEDGNYKYVFEGWYDNAYCNNLPLTSVTMTSDKEIFAKWGTVDTLRYALGSNSYYAKLNGSDHNMHRLVIPKHLQGMPISEINFGSTNPIPESVDILTLGTNITKITHIGNFNGRVIEFPDIGNISFADESISFDSITNVRSLYFHKSVTEFTWDVFEEFGHYEGTGDKTLTIYFDYQKSHKPSGINLYEGGVEYTKRTFTSTDGSITINIVFNGE